MRREALPTLPATGVRHGAFLFEARSAIPLVLGPALVVDGVAMLFGALGAVEGYLVLLGGGLLLFLVAVLVYVFLGEWAIPAGLALSGIAFLTSDMVLAALRPRALWVGVAVALLGGWVLVLALRTIARGAPAPGS